MTLIPHLTDATIESMTNIITMSCTSRYRNTYCSQSVAFPGDPKRQQVRAAGFQTKERDVNVELNHCIDTQVQSINKNGEQNVM